MEVWDEDFSQRHTFVQDYIENKTQARSFFDYGGSPEEMKRRYTDIMDRTYPRETLYQILHTYNQKLAYGDNAVQELKKLRDPETAAVVTGQQAGLLSGPLYTVTKAITVVKEAKEKEKLLNKPVIPIFWIAGEDHDWEEINHIYLPGHKAPQKITYKGFFEPGRPMSDQPVQKTALEDWWKKAVGCLRESSHTKSLYDSFHHLVERSGSITDFFAEWMRWLFRDTGLIMLDAGDQALRPLQTDTFHQIISQNHWCRKAVKAGMDRRDNSVYGTPEGFNEESAQLFYHPYQKRVMLYEGQNGEFTDKQGEHRFDKGFLEKEAMAHPERFSSTALTRPLIQETILPVLAYAGGPGEINYWSLLQPLFHQFDLHLPPVLPRMEAVIIPRTAQTIAHKESLSLREVLKYGAEKYMEELRNTAKQVDGKMLAEELLQQLEPYHARMQEEWEKIAPSEKSFGETNWKIIKDNVSTFANKMDRYQENREECRIQKIKKLEQLLRPYHQPQERIYNILFFLNEYGGSFISNLMANLPPGCGKQYVIKM
ncbi:bacillithiol biosynthesis cysteine-adding enzyme BshC [Salibacterium aidingense]|uniref:bacillithiol biosynthesis cysteine-adding enzyme BshC n=1 Tax=Salibacterium aidingense TaxID=384933 RepID=UPI0003FF7F4B|nr:bacillithiol biosynthesis cysteine-adding enzyme BshC [Salibacterium aidingense]